MPELFDVACHFDDISIADAYSSVFSFKGQFSSFDESSPDGTTAKKRTLSVRPGTTMPARRVISFLGERWIVGEGNVDGIYDRSLRQAYWMKKVSSMVERLTPGEVCAGTTGYSLYASKNYLKDTVNGVSDTQYDPFWDIFCSSTETLVKGQFFKIGAELFRIRGTHQEQSGFNLAQCDQLDSGSVVTATVQTGGAYDPVSDAFTGTNTSVTGLLLESSKFYRYNTQADPKYNTGDMSLIVGATLAVGTYVTISGLRWKIMAVQPELDAFNLHIRVN